MNLFWVRLLLVCQIHSTSSCFLYRFICPYLKKISYEQVGSQSLTHDFLLDAALDRQPAKKTIFACVRRYKIDWLLSSLAATVMAYVMYKKMTRSSQLPENSSGDHGREESFLMRQCIGDIAKINNLISSNITWLETFALPAVCDSYQKLDPIQMIPLVEGGCSDEEQVAKLSDYLNAHVEFFEILSTRYADRHKALSVAQRLESDQSIYRMAHDKKMRMIQSLHSFVTSDYGNFEPQKNEVAAELFKIAIRAEQQ